VLAECLIRGHVSLTQSLVVAGKLLLLAHLIRPSRGQDLADLISENKVMFSFIRNRRCALRVFKNMDQRLVLGIVRDCTFDPGALTLRTHSMSV